MNLTIFGASGRTGKPLVQQALDAGHAVTAFVRNPDKLGISHERLTCVQGDATNADDVRRAVMHHSRNLVADHRAGHYNIRIASTHGSQTWSRNTSATKMQKWSAATRWR